MLNEYYELTEKNHRYLWNKKGVGIINYKFNFLFETKEEYLAFRDEWKVQYKELSQRLREAKMDVRNKMRNDTSVWKEQGHVMSLKGQAHMLLEMRRQGKVTAAEQYQKQREAAVA